MASNCWRSRVATQYAFDVATNVIAGKSLLESLKPSSTWADYGAAALSGVLAASGVGLAGSVAANAAIGGTTYLVNCEIKGEKADVANFVASSTIGAVAGYVGGKGIDGKKLESIARTSKSYLKTAVSPKKVAMYTAKVTACKTIAAKGAMKAIGIGIGSSIVNMVRKIILKSGI